MRISLASVDFDPDANISIELDPGSDTSALTRRVNRVATLDLGSAVSDRGFTHSDRTFRLRWKTTKATRATVGRMVRLHSRVHVTTDEGTFEAVFGPYNPGANESALSLLIIKKVSA